LNALSILLRIPIGLVGVILLLLLWFVIWVVLILGTILETIVMVFIIFISSGVIFMEESQTRSWLYNYPYFIRAVFNNSIWKEYKINFKYIWIWVRGL